MCLTGLFHISAIKVLFCVKDPGNSKFREILNSLKSQISKKMQNIWRTSYNIYYVTVKKLEFFFSREANSVCFDLNSLHDEKRGRLKSRKKLNTNIKPKRREADTKENVIIYIMRLITLFHFDFELIYVTVLHLSRQKNNKITKKVCKIFFFQIKIISSM